eukprot:CAMPEP_0184739174 /NCGR_PEP_ID=MMETSP0315-20130426/2020_1 /TAXON_ID=101924 /ORGANISM="Rhodosorus marinus, Strain UTEX LB 2760" /LENGTH=58 /DNA_ID=CAMNT_0027207725 /DNA_START=52 /DNA_END=229 /DNA_ORIENTATION=+
MTILKLKEQAFGELEQGQEEREFVSVGSLNLEDERIRFGEGALLGGVDINVSSANAVV